MIPPFLDAYRLSTFAPPVLRPSEEGWLFEENRRVMQILLGAQTRLILEVGSWHGLSTRFMLDQAPQASIICVNTWDPGLPTLSTDLERFVASCWGYRDRIAVLKRKSAAALPWLREQGLQPDAVYIDGSHEYEVVKKDIEEAFLFEKALVFGDDCAPEFPGVAQAVTEAYLRGEREFAQDMRCWVFYPKGWTR